MMSQGFQATVTAPDGQQISRVSYHPENAYKNVHDWVMKQQQFAEKHAIIISWKIEAVTGKTIG